MSVLGTIGSLATGAVKATPALLAIKKSLTKTPPKSGASLVEDTKNIPEFIGETVGDVNTGGGQTLDSNKSLQLKRAKEDNANKGYLVKLAKDMDKTVMDSIDNLNISSTIQNISLARLKATEDKKAFLNDANSSQAKAFRKNIGEDKYKLYKDLEAGYKDIKETLTYDKGLAKDYSGARGVADLPLINTIVDKVSGGKYGAYAGAIEDSTAEGVEGLTDWRYAAANLSGGALMFGGMSGVGRVGMTSGLNELGFLVKGSAGGQMIKVANTVQRMSKASPTLYAATVDNGVTAAIQYGIDKVIGGKNSTSDFLNNLFLGAAFPVVLKGGSEVLSRSWKGLKGIVPKDVASLEKAVVNEMKINGAPDVDTAIKGIADTHTFNDGTTLASKIEEYKSITTKNPDAAVSHEEIISTLANDGVTVTSRGGKRIANAITVLNEKFSPDQEVNGAYGTMGENDAIQLAKQEIIAKTKEASVVNGDEADRIIDEALANNGVKKDGSFGVVNEQLDEMEELIVNPNSKPELIPEANNVDDLVKAIDGEGKNVSQKHIDDINGKIDTGNVSVIEDISKASETTGVKFNPERAYKKGVIGEATRQLDTAYLNKISREIELARFGYKGARDKAIKSFTDRVTGITDNLRTTFGKNFESIIGKSLGKTMLRDIGTIVKGALNDTKLKGKVVSGQLNKLADSQGKVITNVGREAAKLAKGVELSLATISRQVRGDIDKISEGFPQLTKSYRKVIKDKYKAKITPSTTFEGVQKILTDAHEEMFIKTAKALESKANGLIEKVNKAARSKSKKAIVDIDTLEKLVETYKGFNKAKAEGDIKLMGDIVNDLDNYFKNGRDLYKEASAKSKAETKSIVSQAIEFLDKMGKDKFEVRFTNTPSGGDAVNDLGFGTLIGNSIASHLGIKRMFKGFKVMEDIFYGNHAKVISEFGLKKRQILDIEVPKVLDTARAALGGRNGDISAKLTLWMRSKSDKGKAGNNMSNFLAEKGKDGKWNIVFVKDKKAWRDANVNKINNGDAIHFGTKGNDGLKEKILNDWYSEMEGLYKNNPEFKSGIDAVKLHFQETGNGIIELGKKLFNKIDFFKDEDYFPFFKQDMGNIDSAFDNQGAYGQLTKNTLEDGFIKRRVDIADDVMIETELGFAENIAGHFDTNVWWAMNVENLLNADRTFRWMMKGRNGAMEEIPLRKLDDVIDIGKFADDIGSTDGVSGLDNPILAKEAATYLRKYTGMVATRGRSLLGDEASRFMSTIVGYDNAIILSSPFTSTSQIMSAPLIPLHAGMKNTISAERSASNANIMFAYNQSGMLVERQRPKYSKEGFGKDMFISEDDGWATTGAKGIAKGLNIVTGNTTKAVDGAISSRAWLAGVAKFLDDNNLAGFKSGHKFDLEKIQKSIMKMENGDEIWKDLVRAGDDTMTRVMGSNQLTEKALASKGSLNQLYFLFQKTGLNNMISTFDTILESKEFAKLRGDNPKLATTVQSAKVALASVAIGALSLINSEMRQGTKEMIGVSQPRDMDEPKNSLAWRFAKAYMNGNFIGPRSSLDVFTGLGPAIKDFTRGVNAEGADMKAQEFAWSIAKVGVNNYYTDFLRFALSTAGVGSTQVDADTWNNAASSLKKEYEAVGKDFSKEPNYEFLVSERIRINKEKSRQAELEKPFKEAEDNFVKNTLKKYGVHITPEELYNELQTNSEGMHEVDTERKAIAIYKKIIDLGVKSSGERDSILAGLPANVLFEIEIKPLVDAGKEGDAFYRIAKLRQKGIIKSDSGADKLLEMAGKYKALK